MSSRICTPLTVIVAAAFLLTSLGCSDFGAFHFTEQSEVIVVEGSGSLPLADLLPTRIPMEVDLQQELDEQDAGAARAVYLVDLYFEMVDDTEEPHFDFLDEITIEVSSSSYSPQPIAWRDPVPDGQHRLELVVDDDLDIKPHAEEGLRLRTQASGTNPSGDAKFKVYATFRVEVL